MSLIPELFLDFRSLLPSEVRARALGPWPEKELSAGKAEPWVVLRQPPVVPHPPESNTAALRRPDVPPGLTVLHQTQTKGHTARLPADLVATPHKFTFAPLAPLAHKGCREFISTPPQPSTKLTRQLRVDS